MVTGKDISNARGCINTRLCNSTGNNIAFSQGSGYRSSGAIECYDWWGGSPAFNDLWFPIDRECKR